MSSELIYMTSFTNGLKFSDMFPSLRTRTWTRILLLTHSTIHSYTHSLNQSLNHSSSLSKTEGPLIFTCAWTMVWRKVTKPNFRKKKWWPKYGQKGARWAKNEVVLPLFARTVHDEFLIVSCSMPGSTWTLIDC